MYRMPFSLLDNLHVGVDCTLIHCMTLVTSPLLGSGLHVIVSKYHISGYGSYYEVCFENRRSGLDQALEGPLQE